MKAECDIQAVLICPLKQLLQYITVKCCGVANPCQHLNLWFQSSECALGEKKSSRLRITLKKNPLEHL